MGGSLQGGGSYGSLSSQSIRGGGTMNSTFGFGVSLSSSYLNFSNTTNAYNLSAGPNGITVVSDGPYP